MKVTNKGVGSGKDCGWVGGSVQASPCMAKVKEIVPAVKGARILWPASSGIRLNQNLLLV